MKKVLFVCTAFLFGVGVAAHADTINVSLTQGLSCSTSSPCGTIQVTDNSGGGVTVTENLAPNFFVITGNGTNHVSMALDIDVAGLTASNFDLPTNWVFGTDAAPAGYTSFDYDYFVQFADPNCNGSSCTGGDTEPSSVTFTINGVTTADFDLSSPFVSDINDAGATGNVSGDPSLAPTPAPEPSSLMMLGTGMLGVAGVIRRRFAH